MKQILIFVLLITAATVTGQEIYTTPFSFTSGTNTPGYQVAAGFMYRSDSGAAFMATGKRSTILKEGRRSEILSVPFGMGLSIGNVVASLHVGPVWHGGNFGVIGGGQFMHVLPINSRLSSIITVDLNTSSFYKSEFTVCMGMGYKIGKTEL